MQGLITLDGREIKLASYNKIAKLADIKPGEILCYHIGLIAALNEKAWDARDIAQEAYDAGAVDLVQVRHREGRSCKYLAIGRSLPRHPLNNPTFAKTALGL